MTSETQKFTCIHTPTFVPEVFFVFTWTHCISFLSACISKIITFATNFFQTHLTISPVLKNFRASINPNAKTKKWKRYRRHQIYEFDLDHPRRVYRPFIGSPFLVFFTRCTSDTTTRARVIYHNFRVAAQRVRMGLSALVQINRVQKRAGAVWSSQNIYAGRCAGASYDA